MSNSSSAPHAVDLDTAPPAATSGPFDLTPGGVRASGSMAPGAVLVNLGCGTRIHPGWRNLDFSPYTQLARRPRLARLLRLVGLLSDLRWERLQQVAARVTHCDLRRGLPFEAASVDVVYLSHVYEHLDPPNGEVLLKRCREVLRPGGICRLVVPDLEHIVNRYQKSLEQIRRGNGAAWQQYDAALEELFEQMVRRDLAGAPNGWRGRLEKWLRGGAGVAGETHRWMYDEVSLIRALHGAGFRACRRRGYAESSVPEWRSYLLDEERDGSEYKPFSVYVEGVA